MDTIRHRYGRLAGALFLLVFSLTLGGCFIVDILLDDGKSRGGGGSNPDAVEPIAGWENSRYDEIAIVKGAGSVTLPSSRAGEDVIIIVTNYGETSREVTTPSINSSSLSIATLSQENIEDLAFSADARRDSRVYSVIQEEYELASRLLPERSPGDTGALTTQSVFSPASYAINDTKQFYRYIWSSGNLVRSSDTLGATLKQIRTDAGWRALVWVQTDPSVVDANVNQLANDFLRSDGGDIFQWVTATYGAPWGLPETNYFLSSETRDIHILVYDISTGGPENIIVGGLFAPVDMVQNAKEDEIVRSNELLVFYINSTQLVDQMDDARSTLAHEFQHMIQFYQRGIRRGSSAQYTTWLNELTSLSAEDLVANHLGIINGPASIRMPDYNAFGALRRLTTWPALNSTENPLPYYGTSFSFGAFLSRVYGAEVMRTLLQDIPAVTSDVFDRDRSYDRWAVAEAVRRVTGRDRSFTELLRRWGVSMVVSGQKAVPTDVRVNRDGVFTTEAGSQTYSLSPLNAYEYSFDYNGDPYFGPVYWNPGVATLPGAANRFVYAGKVPATGVVLPFNLPQDVVVTVLTYK